MLTRTLYLIVSALFVLSGCNADRAPIAGAKAGFELKTLNGEIINARVEPSEGRYNDLIIDNGGKPTLYVFFTTTCPECAKEIPHLIDIKKRYGDKIDLVGALVENIASDEAADFVAFHQINYSVALGAGAFRLAEAAGGVRVIPAMHIYDGKGRYVSHFVGLAPQEMIETRLNALIK
ncbi:MAG: TlpA family protein disulfide reductase [Helicobacteraceae bacterium]|jgi:thiol-disulfide isomerase/thioredoxin|nr:TlpA family protein disulfide reductase [Helicobacteraceae bacterium]